MTGETVASPLALATLHDLRQAEAYVAAVSWIGQKDHVEEIKIVFERVDGGFESFTIAQLRQCIWWRFGDPEQVLRIEALMQPALGRAESDRLDDVGIGAGQLERGKELIRAQQAKARARLAAS